MRILFTDDDPDTRALAIRAVSQEFPAAQMLEARDLAGVDTVLREGAPDILITDLDLHGTDGFQIFDRVKIAAPDCCSLMFTGTGNEELAVRAMKHGFDDYVVKGMHQLRRLAVAARMAFDRGQERRHLTQNRDLILSELYHRLHNNLQIVISLLRLTEKALPQEADRRQLADLRQRIQALGTLQEEFYQSRDFRQVDFGAFLHRLATGLVAMVDGRVKLDRSVGAAILPVDVAVPVALIANELITNALTHAFPDERTGTVMVKLEQEDGRVTLVVTDDGVGFDRSLADAPSGLGLGLVRRLAAQIDGEVVVERRNPGSACVVTFPR